MSIESKAGAAKSLGLGVALLVGAGIVAYLFYKGNKAVSDTVDAVKNTGGYLFGTSDTATFGTDLYSATHDEKFVDNPDQQLKSCLLFYNQNGTVHSDVCRQALMKAGVIQ